MKLRPGGFAIALVVIAAGLLSPSSGLAEDGARRPNIVFFLADDMRNDFLGCAGHPILQTPTLDRLAADGVRFENAFVTTSICAASRATLFTGLYERSHKYTFRTPPIDAEHTRLSYPALLKEAGYRTGFVGKFGVGVAAGQTERMFHYFRPLNRSPYFKPQPDGTERHVEEIAGDRAIEFLQESSGAQPFCLSVSFNAPHAEDNDKENHYPWPKAMDGLYVDVTVPPPRLSDPEIFESQPQFLQESMNRIRFFWRWDTPEKYQKNIKGYYRMISGNDHVIRRVLEEVERLGLSENTVVIFSADNGYYAGNRGFAGKWSHYEESLRTPLIIYDPRLPEEQRGKTVAPMVLNVDIPATILDVAGAPVPDSYQGRSLTPLVRGETPEDWRTDFFCEHLMDHPDIPKWEGVRGERYVYARYFEQDPPFEFLHDLVKDPDQLQNLARDPNHTDVLEKMRRRTNELRNAYGGEYTPEKFPTVAAGRKKR